jgi:hypothetical protein
VTNEQLQLLYEIINHLKATADRAVLDDEAWTLGILRVARDMLSDLIIDIKGPTEE